MTTTASTTTATKRTDELTTGDVVLVAQVDAKHYVLPISDRNPGHRLTVITVTPSVYGAGRKVGQPMTDEHGAPLHVVTVDHTDSDYLGNPQVTADHAWTVVGTRTADELAAAADRQEAHATEYRVAAERPRNSREACLREADEADQRAAILRARAAVA